MSFYLIFGLMFFFIFDTVVTRPLGMILFLLLIGIRKPVVGSTYCNKTIAYTQ